MKRLPPIIVTPGEPGGVGPEIAMKAWQILRHEPGLVFVCVGDVDHLRALAPSVGFQHEFAAITGLMSANAGFDRAMPVLHRPLPSAVEIGRASPGCANWILSGIKEAAEHCMAGHAAAMVTCPVQKESLYAAGFKFQGHTDYLAAIARQAGHEATDVMMLVGGGLRAVPVTVHIPLKDVPRQLTAAGITAQARIVAAALMEKFGIASPRLAVTGLNPHAGENGAMGREEMEIIVPAINALRAEGLQVIGPLPADSAFIPEARRNYDAILCMYHDQALIPVKALDFHGGVNVTLGLPFVRTSPDHGTALSIAGKGLARPDSLVAAIRLAAEMSRRPADG